MSEVFSFGEWMALRRKALGMTQRELAACTNCALATIKKIEQDERRPSRDLAEEMARALHIPADTIALFVECARGIRSAHALAMIGHAGEVEKDESRTAMHVVNLPAPSTAFIGREVELKHVAAYLDDPECRLLTLVGPGGIGKTRLAYQAAAAANTSGFPDGVYAVPLAGVSTADSLLPTIAERLNVAFQGGGDPKAQLLHFLHQKRLLLVLDNLEHLLDGLGLLADILNAARSVKLLATSRERLNLSGEWLFPVSGLTFPTDANQADQTEFSAVQLFRDCARRALPSFRLEDHRTAAIRVCQLVEGMPLAIELAASWARQISCEHIAEHIQRDLNFLSAGRRDVPERHRSISALFEHSWRLLSSEEQTVMMKLSAFRGGFELAAAQAVAGATLMLLSSLKDKSLLQGSTSGRYNLHELVRQYAESRLNEAGKSAETQNQHLDYYLVVAQAAGPGLDGSERATWLARLEQEHDNLRAALAWSQAAERVELAFQLVCALRVFWGEHGHLQEGWRWLEAALALDSTNVPFSLRAAVLNSASIISRDLGEYARAQGLAEQSLALFREEGVTAGIAWALDSLGDLAMVHDNTTLACVLAEESLTLHQELHDQWWIASDLAKLGQIAHRQGNDARAAALFDDSLARFRELEDQAGIASLLCLIGEMLYAQGDSLPAATLLEESLGIFRELENKGDIPRVLGHLARVVHSQGDDRRATGLFQECLALWRERGNKAGVAGCLEGLAGMAAVSGEPIRATHVFAAAARLSETISRHLHQRPIDSAKYEQTVGMARAQLETATFAAAWAQGQMLTLEQAIAEALQTKDMTTDPVYMPDGANSLIDQWDTP
jgi:predicted ATPase/transcriptional regulator with XRE-family HTH domain